MGGFSLPTIPGIHLGGLSIPQVLRALWGLEAKGLRLAIYHSNAVLNACSRGRWHHGRVVDLPADMYIFVSYIIYIA